MLHANLSINVLGSVSITPTEQLYQTAHCWLPLNNHVPRNEKPAFGRSFCLLLLLIGKSPASRQPKIRGVNSIIILSSEALICLCCRFF
jgi:hypothetical protein